MVSVAESTHFLVSSIPTSHPISTIEQHSDNGGTLSCEVQHTNMTREGGSNDRMEMSLKAEDGREDERERDHKESRAKNNQKQCKETRERRERPTVT